MKIIMENENSNSDFISNLSFEEYQRIYRNYISYTESILNANGLWLDCCFKEDILKDALTEAFILYKVKGKNITDPIAFKHWICKSAYNNFRNAYKLYKKLEFCDNCDLDKFQTGYTYESDNDYTWAEIKEHLKGFCSEQDIEFLQKHIFEGYSFKELSVIYNTSESALKQRHKRLLDKLKINLPPLNNYFFCNLKIFCHFLPEKYIMYVLNVATFKKCFFSHKTGEQYAWNCETKKPVTFHWDFITRFFYFFLIST